MHEASIASSLFGVVRRAALDSQATKVVSVDVSIGKLRAVEPHLIQSCFKFLSRETLCEGADLIINNVPITARCQLCGEVREIEKFRFRCDDCGTNKLSILTGRELTVDRILAH